ncbi:unnamed protein product, partial [Phaeothamnion confervicola]
MKRGGKKGKSKATTPPSKIYHFFGAAAPSDAAEDAAKPAPKRKAQEENANSSSSKCAKRSSASIPSPREVEGDAKWGALIDRRKQKAWALIQETVGVPPDRWLRRSFTATYRSVFQDERSPGVGSNSQWFAGGTAFGGGRLMRRPRDMAAALASASLPDAYPVLVEDQDLEVSEAANDDGGGGDDDEGDAEGEAGYGRRWRRHDLENFALIMDWLSGAGVCGHPQAATLLDVALGCRRDDAGVSGGGDRRRGCDFPGCHHSCDLERRDDVQW